MNLFSRDNALIDKLRGAIRPIGDRATNLDPILDMARDCRFVLIGEASHGTHDFYDMRAEITKRLISDYGFNAVVAEADWPDAWRVNRYMRGFDDDQSPSAALEGFRRFPQWMWRNTVMIDFVQWLRDHNMGLLRGRERAGFYGMDLYSLFGSIEEVLKYLDRVDPGAAKRARFRYGCFDHFGEDPQSYGYAASFGMDRSCQEEVVQQLIELRQQASEYTRRDGRIAEDEFFYTEQNARLIQNAENYYRNMFTGRINTWNLRDRHMFDTLQALTAYLDRHVGQTKTVVWAHNSHLGNAAATEMGQAGEFNVGQLVRDAYGDAALLIGFSTYTGTVTAASNWGAEAELKQVRPGLSGSWEDLFHQLNEPRFFLDIRNSTFKDALRRERLQRAIGVIYLPQTERMSHYFHTNLAEQFDAMIHLDRTRALEPLERSAAWTREPETYPTGV